MELTNRFLTDADKREICAWHYEGEYTLYDLPPYEEMKAQGRAFFNPEREQNYRGFFDGGKLVGFVNILEEEREVFIGIGVAPKLCGRGYGCQMLLDTYRISKEQYPEKPLYLEVRSWNTRAVRCYEKAGFAIDGEAFAQKTPIGVGTFYRMIRA